jgi:acyl-CoA synthetase (AMP-forming)/AMP-acid ligase II
MKTEKRTQWSNVGEALDESCSHHGDREAVVFPEPGLTLSYAQLQQHVDHTARGLMALGAQKGDIFALWAENGFIILKDGFEYSAEDVRGFCRGRIAISNYRNY